MLQYDAHEYDCENNILTFITINNSVHSMYGK